MKKFFTKIKDFFANADCKRKAGWKFVTYVTLLLVAVIVGSMVQTAGWKYKVKDLRNESNTGTISIQATDKTEAANYTVKGSVVSGMLFVPKKASATNKVPAVVFTHGLYNNREMQEQNTIEAVRRGYAVLQIDCKAHGHNEDGTVSFSGFDGENLLGAAKYLWNLPYVDQSRIAVSGHSMGGGETSTACQKDGVDTTYSVRGGDSYVGQTDASLKAGYHMGIISAAIVQANNLTSSNFGSNMLGAAGVKASSDEFFYSSTVKEDCYDEVAKSSVTELNYTQYYTYDKKTDTYTKVTEDQKYKKHGTYYKLVAAGQSGNSTHYLQSRQAVLFTKQAADNTAAEALEKWETVNGGIYADGELVAQPSGKKLVSVARKGAAVAERNADGSVKTSIRAVYEAKETHPMNHFSVKTASHIIDFLYCCFGVSEIASFKAPTNQTWLVKEIFAIAGFVGIFGLVIAMVDFFLRTKTFKVLAAKEEDIEVGAPVKGPRKIVSYVVTGLLTTWFGAWSLRNITAGKKIYSKLGLSDWFASDNGYVLSNIGKIAAWGLVCAAFAVVLTVVVWGINHVINVIVYKEKAEEHDEHPFAGFRIRGVEEIIKTLVLGVVIVAIFYGIVNVIWWLTKVDLRFWTFDLRVFNFDRISVYLNYAKWFFIYYLITSALSINFRAKNLPEWLTIIINIAVNVAGITFLMGQQNAHFINTGAMLQADNSLFYIACYPIIPCVAFATVLARRIYKRTGNAWLAAIINTLIMTFLACANTSIDGAITQVSWWLH